jgi:hypothetical protein
MVTRKMACAAVEPAVSLTRACLSGSDEKAIERKRGNEGNEGGRYNNRRHKPLAHNLSSYNGASRARRLEQQASSNMSLS